MKLTTLCYIENERDEYLMLHRTKKENDLNHDKWIGVGGKFEGNETPEECLLREVYEETGLRLLSAKDVGYIEWLIDGDRHLCILFESESYEGELKSNDEGENLFIDIKDLYRYQFSTDFDKILDIYGIIY